MMEWIKYHTMLRWLEKERRDGPQIALTSAKITKARHYEKLSLMQSKVEAMRLSL
jgi:hypothetical protein